MPSSEASRCSTGAAPPGRCDSPVMSTETVSAVVLVTSWLPASSRIWPRTAGTITSLVWFCAARPLYVLALSTCTYHNLPPSVISMAAATR